MVSSYTPTLSSLHRLLTSNLEDQWVPGSVGTPQMLLIGQPESTAGLASLPKAQVKVDCVRELVPIESLINTPDTLGFTVDYVLAHVTRANVLHFACHGHQDQDNPLNSGFDMKDGWLTLGQLMRVSTSHAQLAYLSACESAGTDESRPDETLNLAGAMISIGFKSVIATLW